MAAHSSKNILIVDGFATGSQYAARIRARGMVPYHITSGLEKTSALSAEFMDKYIATQVGDAYAECWRMPDDFNAAAEGLKKYNFQAVIPGTETGVIAAERLAHYFGLPVNSPNLLYARRDKFLMQKALEDAGLACINSLFTSHVEEAVEWFRQNHYRRIIIKPARSAGTDGVRSCTSEEEIRDYFEHSYLNKYDGAGNFNDGLVLQEYIEGDELIVNCVSRHGKHALTDVLLYNKLLTSAGVPVYEASRLIHKLDARMEEAVAYTFKVLDALGILYGSSHNEIKLTPKGPVLIESGARIMGSTPPVYYEVLGQNLVDRSLDAYLDDAAFARDAQLPYAPKKHLLAKFFISSKAARVSEVTAEKTLRLLETFAACNFNTLNITKQLRKTVDMPSKPGDVLLISEDEHTLLRDYNICRYLEHKCSGLLYRCEGESETEEEKQLLENLKDHVYPEHRIDRFLYGWNMAYKNYKNSVLYVLRPDLTHCEPGETGDIYVAGAYMAKKAYDMPCLRQQNFVTNPFYTTACTDRVLYPFLYNTREQAEVNADGSITFINPKTGTRIRSFGRSGIHEAWPLTYTERQMVAEQQVSPDSNAYNAKFTFKLEGILDVGRLLEALKTWISRYRIFRSYYPVVDGKFVHRLSKGFPVEIAQYTCSFSEALDLIEQHNVPYDLTAGPLYRFSLFHVGKNEHLFHINMHHIIADGTSLISIIEELWKLYRNKRAKKFRLERQDFLDYADWQAQYENSDAKKQFFLDLFKDGVPENEMPIRASRPEILPHATEVSRELLFDISQIEAAAKKMHVSTALFMMMAASLTLAKYCASEDIALGMIMNGRTHPQTKEMFGMFVNAVPIRFRPQKTMTLGQYAEVCAKIFRGAIENQTCPFEILAPILAPARNLSRKPVFDVIVNYRGEIRPYEIEDLKISSVQMRQATQIDMQFEMVRSVSGMNVSISYSDKLYDPSVVEDMLCLMEKIINTMIRFDSTGITLGKLEEVPPKQRALMLHTFAGNRVAYDLTKTPLDCFHEQVQRQPDRPAVAYLDEVISYGELDRWSSVLAHTLAEKGVRAGDKVAVLINRTELAAVCALGVLKADAAYVPLDPAHPSDRLHYVLQDTGTQLVLADENLLPLIGQYKGGVMTMREVRALREQPAPDYIASRKVSVGDLFVIFYTSGTTGKPKGVMLTHQNVAAYCYNHIALRNLSARDRVASCSGFMFDASLGDLYAPLMVGACTHIISEEMRLDLPALNDYFERKNISGCIMTTQLGRQFVTGVHNKSLRWLAVGGETLTPVAPPKDYALYNVYGPTESTVYVTNFRVDKLYERVPLGKPLANTDIYITDKDGSLCPVGTFGELCVSGPNLAKGYLNLPELTDERFVPNPFSYETHFEKMYKTGDIARWMPDGNIDFIGRRDCQVKVRGFRIELSEIEGAMRRHPDIKNCAVIARADKSDNKYIIGYFVADKPLAVADIKHFLEDTLPPYMIPDFFMQIPAVPINPNGKLDAASLPDVLEGVSRTHEYVAPKGRVERQLALIWADVLNLDAEKISREDRFFDIGGTSLRSTELSLRVRNTFKENMPPAVVFKYPKLKDQAAYLNKHNRFSMVYAFNEKGARTPIFFVHTANTGAEAYVPLAEKLPEDQPFYAVEPHNIFSEEAPIRGVKELAARYVRYIRRVNPDGPYILGGWSFGAVVAYEMAVLLRREHKEVEQLYLLDPIIEHCEQEKALMRSLMETSFFQGYLNSDPLFGRFKKLGYMDKLVENNKNVLEDMFAYSPSRYDGKVTLFKATRLEAIPKDVDKKMASQLRKFQMRHRDEANNGLEKYVKALTTIRINAIHNYMMRGTSLEKIAQYICGSCKAKRKK